MQNKLRGYLTDNSVTSDPNDKILVLDPAGNVGLPEIYVEMRFVLLKRILHVSIGQSIPIMTGLLPNLNSRLRNL
ncbi:hypothetical protein DWW91_05590 [Parabacteroides sp. AF17-3]|nr:hypothetical protein DWW91_05590 [Parabacteroides sp. AF17-3]